MPTFRPRTALPLTLAMAALIAGPALLSVRAEPLENPGRSRAPVSLGEVSSQADDSSATMNGRSRAPLSLQGEEAAGIGTGNTRSRAPIATP